MPVNNIALQPFQGESPVGSYLSSYADAQRIAQQNEAAERNKVLASRQDEQYDQDKRMKAIDALGGALDGVQDEAGFEQVKQWAVSNRLLDPAEAGKYTFANLPQIRAMSQQAREMMKQRQSADMEGQKFDLYRRSTEANIDQSRAATDVSRANADYIRGGKMGGGGGAGGGKYGAGGKPLTERESKDLSWALRGDAANKEFTPERITHLIDSRNVIGRNVPLVGNKLQTDKSRQAVQTAKNFVAVVLRKDTGAAVTEKEFDFYEDIFIPAWGDDDDTLQMKSQARTQFLQALKMGLGPRAALAQLGVQAPEGLAPPEDDKTSVIEAQGGWSATVEE